ncbi:M16 family metallopeptidase [Aquimarina pacifica]|uniref:M16 family metallopeptidase n=1 Tax=Aquimarina pacifica TaxID=1296415 RepID=UPI000471ABCE|nr:M16 family metallopeptidase [Aquimarina pacifica]
MKFVKLILLLIGVSSLSNCKKAISNENISQEITVEKHTDKSGFSYETVNNDPTGLRLYTLENGLKVYLAKNEEEPKIQTLIAVKAGSTYDPADNTGLAHYLEHMVFKGTDSIGTLDYEKEKVLLQKISDLYEEHKAEKDEDKKKDIYNKIDEVSLEASKLSIANEYDKLVNSLGAEGTNAFTSNEQTVYVNKIPTNELEKWLDIESERFSKLVLRLFHTELEAVYEEFNRSQDSDRSKQYQATLELLYPNHPYGKQTTIGESEHLKNPSMRAIQAYYDTYYVPNNMAIILVGDIEFEDTIKKVNDAFGSYEYKEVNHPDFSEEAEIQTPRKKEVYGPTAESIYVAFRTPGFGTKEHNMFFLIDYLLANSQAGLIDLNLNQKQKVQYASSFTNFDNDYGFHLLYGMPKENQTLDEVKELLLNEIEKIKKGEFDDWLIGAVINDLKLTQIRKFENATPIAYEYLSAFIHSTEWKDRLAMLDDMNKITKQDVIDFANKNYSTNYIEVHKIKGEDKNIVKVENPKITPIDLNRDKESHFLQNLMKKDSKPLEPKFVDYKSAIKTTKTKSGLEVSYVENETNDLFNLNLIFDLGIDNDKMLSIASGYFDFLGTDKYSPEDLKKEFYKLGINYSINSSEDKTLVGISGLKENLDQGLLLLEDLWKNAVPNQEAYDKYIDRIAKGRQDGKTQKGNILWGGLMSYGKYGEHSGLRNIYTIKEMKTMNPQELVDKIKGLSELKHRIFYYGNDINGAISSLDKTHAITEDLKEYPEALTYVEKETGGNVYFVDYDMVQSEMVFLAKGSELDPKKMAAASVFNTYFGSGLSSIVFQEIRESKSLAYSAFSKYDIASKKGQSDYVYAYIGTQTNKMSQAVDAMMDLMTNMPESEQQFKQAKEATLKKIAAKRITKDNIFWTYERLKNRGIEVDHREEIYHAIKNMTMSDLKEFFEKNIKGETYNILVIGNKKEIDMKALSKLGVVKEFDIDYLFNYEKKKEDIKL